MNKTKFKCWKTNLYRTCKKCSDLHGGICDYEVIINFKPIKKRNRCPICIHKKNLEKCLECKESKLKKIDEVDI